MMADFVDVPVELELALEADPVAADAFAALSPSHRREHAAYVGEAKKPETRERRAERTVQTLRPGAGHSGAADVVE